MGESMLGPLTERVKTDVRLPGHLMKVVDQLCHDLGIPKNAFVTVSVALLSQQLFTLEDTSKRRAKLKEVLEESLTELRNALSKG